MVTSTPAPNIPAARIQRSRAAPARTSYKMAESEEELDEKPVTVQTSKLGLLYKLLKSVVKIWKKFI